MPTAALPGIRDQLASARYGCDEKRSEHPTRILAAGTFAPLETIQAITGFLDKLPESCDGPLIPDIGEQVAKALEIPLKFFTILHDW